MNWFRLIELFLSGAIGATAVVMRAPELIALGAIVCLCLAYCDMR